MKDGNAYRHDVIDHVDSLGKEVYRMESGAYERMLDTIAQMKRHSYNSLDPNIGKVKELAASSKGFSIEFVGPDGSPEPKYQEEVLYESKETGKIYGQVVYFVPMVSGAYELGDWELAGVKKIVRTTDKDDFVEIEALGGHKVPEEEWHSTDDHCDQCHRSAGRNKLYLLQHRKTGEWRQVGKTCLKEYGFSGENTVDDIIRRYKTMTNLAAYIGEEHDLDEERFFGGGYSRREYVTVPLLELVAHAAAVTREYGYRTDKRDDYRGDWHKSFEHTMAGWWRQEGFDDSDIADISEGEMSTKLAVEARFWKGDTPSEEDIAYAEKVIGYIRTKDDSDNEFQENFNGKLRHLAQRERIPENRVGMVVFWPVSYEIHLKEEAQQAAFEEFSRQFKEEFVADEGTRIKGVPVEFLRIAEYQSGYYGMSYWLLFKDDEGRLICWKTSKADVETYHAGDRFSMTATVKEHHHVVPEQWAMNEAQESQWNAKMRKLVCSEVTRAKLVVA